VDSRPPSAGAMGANGICPQFAPRFPGSDLNAAASAWTRVEKSGAGNETRTRDPDLGKVVLYQLSYSRTRIVRADSMCAPPEVKATSETRSSAAGGAKPGIDVIVCRRRIRPVNARPARPAG
jgi:hypothetical protein